MFGHTFAFLSRLSMETMNPSGAYKAMHKLFISNIKLRKTIQTVRLIERLLQSKQCFVPFLVGSPLAPKKTESCLVGGGATEIQIRKII